MGHYLVHTHSVPVCFVLYVELLGKIIKEELAVLHIRPVRVLFVETFCVPVMLRIDGQESYQRLAQVRYLPFATDP